MNKLQQHGRRNRPDWQRMSRRERERMRRRQDIGAVAKQLDEVIREHNRLVVQHRALERFVLEVAHAHPERTAGGLHLVSRGSATPPEPRTAARLRELYDHVLAELQAIEAKATADSGSGTDAAEATA